MVDCPVCGKPVKERDINAHLDSACQQHVQVKSPQHVASFFQTPAKRAANGAAAPQSQASAPVKSQEKAAAQSDGLKRSWEDTTGSAETQQAAKKSRTARLHDVAPLADRMRPRTLDDVYGQDLVGADGVVRGLVEQDRVPSMVLWGGPGTGKTTIARLIAQSSNARFVEINSTSTGIGECKRLFAQALNELQLTGRKTIIFCDEIHRFSKSQQDVFLGPVEAGLITLVGATTENPSFKVISALLSRCRVFTLSPLNEADLTTILERALSSEYGDRLAPLPPLLSGPPGSELLSYLATSASGDARTALNLLELAMSLSEKPDMTLAKLKDSLTHTLIYDRQGDAHYDTISALHKSIRGSDPHASLYYLARMLASGEDPLYIARRLIVVASEDVGLADNAMLPLATATHDAVQKIGLPEASINLGHCVTALALAPKSTRAYRGLGAATAAVRDPSTGGLPVPLHLRNAPTRLMREVGYGRAYKYNPDFVGGRCRQDYLPEGLRGARFLGDLDLGTRVDSDLEDEEGGADGAHGRGNGNVEARGGAGNENENESENEAGTDGAAETGADSNRQTSAGSQVLENSDDGHGQHREPVGIGDLGDDEDGNDEELWEQDESGLWAVRKSSQAQAPAD